MDWLQLTLSSSAEQLESFEELMLEAGAVAITYRDAEDNPIFEPGPGEMPLWGEVRLTALFPQGTDPHAVAAKLCPALGIAELPQGAFEDLPDREWERAWLDDFEPMRFGERLWIVPNAFEPPDDTAVNLRLDPGLAFGTGTHPTTALCLSWLDECDLSGKTVLDFGCGSGVLAIAALLLGAERAIATDIDPQALTATLANAEANGVIERLQVYLPKDLPELQADITLANILAGPLQELAPQLAEMTCAEGSLVLSGLLHEQIHALQQCYGEWFTMEVPALSGDWARLSGERCPGELVSTA